MKKTKDILVILIFIFSIIFFLFSILLKPKENLIKNDKNDITENEIDYTEQTNINEVKDTIFVNNMNSFFSKYTGEIQRIDVSKFIRNIVLEKILVIKEVKNIQEYFNNNNSIILNDFGISKYSDFENLYKYINDYESEIISITIDSSTVKIDEKTSEFEISVIFESTNEKRFKIIINNILKSNEPNMIFLSV